MKSVGLITEYNPFHNGHLYHAQQAKLQSNADVSIAIMSGNFVMRGEPAFYNKFVRTQMALSGVDLIVELPTIATLSSSDYFAQLGIKVADYLDIDAIAFGSELADVTRLENVAKNIIELEDSSHFQELIKEGKSYAKIIHELIDDQDILQYPNNILGVAYLKAISQYAPTIKGLAIQRLSSAHHDKTINHDTFASGSSIRQSILNDENNWKTVVPSEIKNLYGKPHLLKEDTFQMIKYNLLSRSAEELSAIYTMSEGLEHRLQAHIQEAHSFETFMSLIKTKRFTYTHLQRVLMQILLNITKNDYESETNSVRILGMNQVGQQYLKYLKSQFPERQYITNVNKKSAHFFKNEIKATQIYNLLSGQTAHDFNTPVIRQK
ncbi:nucleotidyltransferase [Staphylococcus sp. NRL 16/872]|uniref:nucleotidyltransferase n=1 Tax=Staphylococcus sp. NRL 16/872 TaxID=2930131 RepID=UPI001FB5351A|nr:MULTISPECIES: nucleotidyltransferase [unclassified Staphylococcus]MCJ1656600.1 nucleotidyltransferase [Staphylococcus sp. NRL 21/187]MCJ1662354.1 nucleotidyltransferase [Staphylococcus sp. NRL 18/288]MCJ1668439.1 nucleotidyltransferase [Staphylococcus sp. NRL 19/737]WEN68651.1 nucleotidyltransferase [Staphylococcus sp. NRL 16/872]